MTDEDRKRLRGEIVSWWRRLLPDDEGYRGDRAAAARLRRAESLHEIMVEGEAIRLYRIACDALGRARLSESEAAGIAIVAGVLAGVRPAGAPGFPPFAEMLGRMTDGQRQFSPLRFAALAKAQEPVERLRHLRRAVALCRGKPFNVARFAEDMLWWNDNTRRRWIFEYHQEGRAAPTDNDASEGTVQ